MMSFLTSRPCTSILGLALVGAAQPAFSACTIPDAQTDRIVQVERLAPATYDIDQMDCAAMTALKAAEAAPDDQQVQALALGVTAGAIDLMGSVKREDLSGNNPALINRINELGASADAVAVAALSKNPNDPPLKILRAAIILLLAPWQDTEQGLAQSRVAGTLLDEAMAADPKALGGMAQMLRGRMYFELPTMLGGDLDRSVQLLEEAVRQDPANAQALRFLAETYDQEMKEAKAKAMLQAMLKLSAEQGKLQQLSDELRMGAGLARRLGEAGIAIELDTKRVALLKQHPELLTRVSTAVSGHGGKNPLTGK